MARRHGTKGDRILDHEPRKEEERLLLWFGPLVRHDQLVGFDLLFGFLHRLTFSGGVEREQLPRPVRRILVFVERSIDGGLQWAGFVPLFRRRRRRHRFWRTRVRR
jgi:hypothetical protein